MNRFLLIGLDGAEPSLLTPWMDAGLLPNLAGLRDRGAFLPCASTVPPATFPAWTTCVTGVNPGRHGIFDFTETVPDRYGIRFVNATQRRVPALWEILSDANKRVSVLGVPATYPPEKVNGFMVSGFDSPVCTAVDRSFVYPDSLYPEVKDWRFADFQESDIGPGWHETALRKLLAGVDTKEGIARRLLEREPWDFFMVVFGESDTVSHHFWLFHDEHSPRHRPGFEDAIQQIYVRLDRAVGGLIAAAGPNVVVGVVSDHGFGGTGTGVVHLNNWLAENGYLRFSGDSGSPLKTAAMKVVPETWRGAVFRRFQGMATRAESRSRVAGIDWRHTAAWSEELNYFPSIRINLKGREPDGQVDPGDYSAFCADLCRKLETWAPVRSARTRNDVYQGKYIERAPDILVELALDDGYSHSCLRARGGLSFRRIGPEEYLGGKERGMNGSHRPTGVLLLSEPTHAQSARLEDVAPTVLACLGVAAPHMDGHSLLGRGDETMQDEMERPEVAYTAEQERALEGRLRDWGYYE